MIEKSNLLECSASIPMDGVTPIFASTDGVTGDGANAYQNQCTLVHTATGTFELTLGTFFDQIVLPVNVAVPLVSIEQPFGSPRAIGVVVVEPRILDGVVSNVWTILTTIPTDSSQTPNDFPGQMTVHMFAIGDPGGTGI